MTKAQIDRSVERGKAAVNAGNSGDAPALGEIAAYSAFDTLVSVLHYIATLNGGDPRGAATSALRQYEVEASSVG